MAAASEDEVLLAAARLVVGISVRAADRIGEASLVQLRALTVLSELPGANLVQLAEGMGVTVSTTSRLVDRLVTAGLVERRPSELTRREISISLTPVGEQVLERYDGMRVSSLRARMEQLGARQRKAAFQALERLVATGPGDDGRPSDAQPAAAKPENAKPENAKPEEAKPENAWPAG
jgi:DNA-binding MarR family transcriptional regulator